MGETEHKTSKSKWKISNFRNFEKQLANTISLRELISKIYLRLEEAMGWEDHCDAPTSSSKLANYVLHQDNDPTGSDDDSSSEDSGDDALSMPNSSLSGRGKIAALTLEPMMRPSRGFSTLYNGGHIQ
jgi:hypothetical protein